MRRLSISLAWEQTKSCVAADGRLLATVAAALVALPLAVLDVISPGGISVESAGSSWPLLVAFVFVLLLLMAQLAFVRLAIGPSVSVGEAIVHGARRFPVYFLANLLIGIVLFLFVMLCLVFLRATGVAVGEGQIPASPAVLAVMLIIAAVYCFVWVRFFAMAAPVASAEAAGPIAIIRRSWDLTAGHFWRLLGFVLLFLVGAFIALLAVQAVAVVVAGLLIGPVAPLSLSALIVGLIDGVANAVVITLLTVMLARIYVQLSGRGSIDVSVPSSGA